MEFNILAINSLENLYEKLETNEAFNDLEIDFVNNEVLYIASEKNQEYVINKHSPSRQIWFSSPLTGTYYFSYDISKKLWLDKEGKELEDLIIGELKRII
ncbi:frataxin-like protein [Rickettsiales bacterium Ac37b]|nr:frataxin-like protein [Rickettsiales bacterium Ac37b]